MTRHTGTLAAVISIAALAAACTSAGPSQGPATEGEAETMRLTSESFADGESIPARHTCDGEDVSPPLAWSDVPDGTAAFVLIVDDPDARGFVHWLLTNIPGDTRSLAEGEGDSIGQPGPNDFGRSGWGGPCPPAEHEYTFTLYALSAPIQDGGDADAARSAAEASALALATLTGRYARR